MTIKLSLHRADVRYIALLYEGSIRCTYSTAHHARTQTPINLRLTCCVADIQMRPPWAAQRHGATFSDATRVVRTGYESSPWSQPRYANRIAILKCSSFSASEPTSRPKAAARKRRTRPDQSCRARDTTFVHVSAQQEARGDRRHTGWMGVGRRMLRRF